jgi:hypothetical protein
MAATKVSKKTAGAGFTLIGIVVWIAAALVAAKTSAEVASLGVIFGGAVSMGGIALMSAVTRPLRCSRSKRKIA